MKSQMNQTGRRKTPTKYKTTRNNRKKGNKRKAESVTRTNQTQDTPPWERKKQTQEETKQSPQEKANHTECRINKEQNTPTNQKRGK